jgi:hypothetical protein
LVTAIYVHLLTLRTGSTHKKILKAVPDHSSKNCAQGKAEQPREQKFKRQPSAKKQNRPKDPTEAKYHGNDDRGL